MIVCAILEILIGLLDALFALLPDWEIAGWSDVAHSSGAGELITVGGVSGIEASGPLPGLLKTLMAVNHYVPVDHVIWFMTLTLLVIFACLGFRAVRWIINVVRGAGA